ncbi:type II secretion system protein M [Undibacterium sp. CY7W]|uniref:Type II secretion system protein M n=1 Tax=Undibacterium rugosum TaxID=2762291 RepID=A0A923KYV8_9BURK|nr:type II secretion system protein GspM [Undibacterium rugosum]MBC3934968.1 type II secretion system protein M [Undibacterium rugosum]
MQKELLAQFFLYWNARNPREQKMLSAAAVVLLLTLLFMILIDPALSGVARLQKEIPQNRQKLAEMTAMNNQYAQLAANLNQMVEPVSRESIENSLSARGMKAQTLSVVDEVVRLQIQSASYANVMEWLVELQKSARVVVDEAKLNALPETGQVNVNLTLRQQRANLQ